MGTVSGLTPARLRKVRGRLVEFAEEMFEPMRRKDQRRWGEVYLRGLMLDGRPLRLWQLAAELAQLAQGDIEIAGVTERSQHGL